MNNLEIFENHEFGQVRMVEVNGKPFAVGNDIAKALEYARPYEAVSAHCKGAVSYRVLTAGGEQETKIIPEGDIYRLISKAAEQSKNPVIKEKAERFESWLFDEVVPSIRKHGAYMTPETIEKAILNPDFIINLAGVLKEEQQKNALLTEQIEQEKPKVIFADSVAASHTTILVGELAKLLKQNGIDMGQNRLFGWMRNNGFLISRNGTDYNMPTQKSMNMGLFVIKETSVVHSDGHTSVNKTPKITGKGQQYFINKFLGENPAAVEAIK